MGIELYKHGAVAYDKVKKMFETEKRVAVIHPTGCGKSFISLKWLEENRNKKAIFLAPTVSILRQITKHIESCGMSMKDFPNLKRYTYSKLSKMTDEEIANLNVDMVVLDEFHRCGANEWSKGISKLINQNSSAQVLGLSATPIRYLDEHRDMAEELFQGNVASEITLAEALSDGILPMPTYINAVYSFQEDIDNLQQRINKEKRVYEKLQEQQYLDEAKKILEKAEGLSQIFAKHITNKSGKYIVFCRDKKHMEKMMEEAKTWFQGVNDEIDMSSVASFIPKSENMKVFDEFYHSNNEHLKLLFSIDMLNEGIHVPNIDGVIMLRPTNSPIIYKQQLGRALSVGHNSNPLVFDIVNNVQSCEMISHFYKELRETALVKFTQTGKKEDQSKIEAFKISDTVRQIQDIFNKIDNFLNLSWDDYYNMAVEYYKEHGNLLVPNNYSKDGMNLGMWISDQRKTMKGQGHRRQLTSEQIEKLDAIDMVWDKFKEQWDETYNIAKEYYAEHGNLDGLRDKKIKGKNIYQWLGDQIKSYNKGILLEERMQLLEQIGIVWNQKETRWYEMYDRATKHYEENGNLTAVTDEELNNWLKRQRQAYRGKGTYSKLSEEQTKKLELIGMVWDVKENSYKEMYDYAKKYYEDYGTLLLPYKYTDNGKDLHSWVKEKRKAYKKGKLSQEQIEELEAIGMIWDVNEYKWNQMYIQAKLYYTEHGNLVITPKVNKQLYQWLKIQKKLYAEDGKLTEQQKELLSLIEMDKETKKETCIKPKEKRQNTSTRSDTWKNMYEQAREYYNLHGDLLVPRTDEYKKLSSWIKTQRRKYKANDEKNSLSMEEIDQLEKIGMVWDVKQYQWDTMYAQAKEYSEKYGTLSIPMEREEEYKLLRTWLSDKKMAYKGQGKTKLSETQIKQLEEIGIIWDINQTSWDIMYQQAQEYYNMHGDLLVPRTDEYNQLTNWIKGQRKKYKSKDGLSQEEIENLEAIGMVWDAKQYQWDTMYAQAKQYYEEHGNLSFPYKDERYKKLGNWIQNKKSGYYGKGSCKLTDEQIRQLQDIGALPYDTDECEESLEKLENKLQTLVNRKKETSQLVEDYGKLQEKKSHDKGVEK